MTSVQPAATEQARFVANERYRADNPGGQMREGNLPRSAAQAVHAVDDVVLRANRLRLLNEIRVATRTVADFSRIEG